VDPQAPSPSPLAAHCQLHAGQPFTGVCPRCGTYMCNACTEGGRYPSCPACRERTGVGSFPFTRDNYTLSGLFSHAVNVYKQNWGVLAGAMILIFVALLVIGGFVAGMAFLLKDSPVVVAVIQIVMYIPQLAIQGVGTLGILHLGIKAANGQKVELEDVFSTWRRLGTWIAQSFLTGALFLPVAAVGAGIVAGAAALTNTNVPLMVGLGLVVFVAVMYLYMGLSFASCEIVAQPSLGAVAGMKNSWAIASGKRLDLILLGVVSLMLYVAGVIACVIGALFAIGLVTCLFATFYLTLRNGTKDLIT
jgi:hypothetical protein